MTGIKEYLESICGSPDFFEEIVYAVNAKYYIKAANLPSEEQLLSFLSLVNARDSVSMVFDGISSLTITQTSLWLDLYPEFLSSCEPDDDISIELSIQKRHENNTLSIYSFESFKQFVSNSQTKDLISVFAKLMSGQLLHLETLDADPAIFTNSISISSTKQLPTVDREELQKKCLLSSLFLDINTITLFPEDFSIRSGSDNLFNSVFQRLKNIFSLAYVANTSHFKEDKLVLSFSPERQSIAVDINEDIPCPTILDIYQWIMAGDKPSDRAAIARKIIDLHTKGNNLSLSSIDKDVFDSIKSNYMLYQHDTIDQYIETKNKISECILETTKSVLSISHDIIEGFRNNFIGVLGFLITTLFTDSLEVDVTTPRFSNKALLILNLFFIASCLYLLASIVIAFAKWRSVREGYISLKENYSNSLDPEDIKQLFGADKPLKKARKRVIIYSVIIFVLWAILLYFLWTSIQSASQPKVVDEIFAMVSMLRG